MQRKIWLIFMSLNNANIPIFISFIYYHSYSIFLRFDINLIQGCPNIQQNVLSNKYVELLIQEIEILEEELANNSLEENFSSSENNICSHSLVSVCEILHL